MSAKAVHICHRCRAEERTDSFQRLPNFWAEQTLIFPQVSATSGVKLLCDRCLGELRNWLSHPTLYQVTRKDPADD